MDLFIINKLSVVYGDFIFLLFIHTFIIYIYLYTHTWKLFFFSLMQWLIWPRKSRSRNTFSKKYDILISDPHCERVKLFNIIQLQFAGFFSFNMVRASLFTILVKDREGTRSQRWNWFYVEALLTVHV